MLFWSFPPVDSPSRITGHRRLCRNAWQNTQERLACLRALCLNVVCGAIENPRAVVQKLWMMGTSCGNARKKRQKLERNEIRVFTRFEPTSIVPKREPIVFHVPHFLVSRSEFSSHSLQLKRFAEPGISPRTLRVLGALCGSSVRPFGRRDPACILVPIL